MFVACYNFTIKPNTHSEFEEAWKEVTQLIYHHAGSLGSRLYKSGENSYFGIAQWPDKKTWEDADISSFDVQKWREKMRACCDKIEMVNELKPVLDLWMDKPFTD